MKTFKEIDALIKTRLRNHNQKSYPVLDGIVNEHEYLKAKFKILWVLKEAHDKNGGGWDLREFIGNRNKLTRYVNWKRTFGNIVHVTYSILNGFKEFNKKEDNVSGNQDRIDILKKIAFINLKKIPGKAVSNYFVIKKSYEQNKDIIMAQIKLCDPDIVICGGTMSIIAKEMGIDDKLIDKNGIRYFATTEKIFIDTYHPNYRGSQEEYCNSIIKIVKGWSQNKK